MSFPRLLRLHLLLLSCCTLVFAYDCDFEYRTHSNPLILESYNESDTFEPIRILIDTSVAFSTQYMPCTKDVVNNHIIVSSFGQKLYCTEEDLIDINYLSVLKNLATVIQNKLNGLVNVKRILSVSVPLSESERVCADNNAFVNVTLPRTWAEGYNSYDLLLFLTLSPAQSQAQFAFSEICRKTKDGRPIMGFININPRAIKQYLSQLIYYPFLAESDFPKEFINMLTHELIHFLGFRYDYYKDSVQTSSDTFRGNHFKVLTSPNVLALTKSHFDCPSAQGLPLEDAFTANSSHIEKRILNGDLMNGGIVSGSALLSDFDVAVLSDLPFYEAPSSSKAASLSWGKSKKCSFFSAECSSDEWGYSCVPYSLGCYFDPQKIGYCFGSKNGTDVIGYDSSANNCFYYSAFAGGDCTDTTKSSDPLTGESFSHVSRCFSSSLAFNSPKSLTSTARCFGIHCISKNSQTYLRVKVGSYWVDCEPGKELTVPGYAGTIICPLNIELYCPSSDPFIFYDGSIPEIESISPNPAEPGSKIMIKGKNFDGSIDVFIESTSCIGTKKESNSYVSCTLPAITTGKEDVNVGVVVQSTSFNGKVNRIYRDFVISATKSKNTWVEKNTLLFIALCFAAFIVLLILLITICVCCKSCSAPPQLERSWTITELVRRQNTNTRVTASAPVSDDTKPLTASSTLAEPQNSSSSEDYDNVNGGVELS